MALPAVVTGVAGPRDITGGNGTAWLIDDGGRGSDGLARPRPEDLAVALREIRDDPAEALKRAAAGRERVARLYSPAVVARRSWKFWGMGSFFTTNFKCVFLLAAEPTPGAPRDCTPGPQPTPPRLLQTLHAARMIWRFVGRYIPSFVRLS